MGIMHANPGRGVIVSAAAIASLLHLVIMINLTQSAAVLLIGRF